MHFVTFTMRGRGLVIFVPVAFLLSWYPTLLHLAGVERAQGINPLGVLLAALICTAIEGEGEVKRLLRSIIRVKAPVVCYAVALLLPLVLLGGSAAITALTGAARPTPAQLATWPQMADKFIFMLLFVGLGEEPGWRGFAIPQLQKRLSPVASTMVLAPIWLLWHAPLFATGEFSLDQVAPFAITLFGGSLALTWLYNRSGGSVLQPMLMHAAINAVGAGYVFRMFHGAELTRMWWVYAAVWAVAGGIFAAVMRVKRSQALAMAASNSE